MKRLKTIGMAGAIFVLGILTGRGVTQKIYKSVTSTDWKAVVRKYSEALRKSEAEKEELQQELSKKKEEAE
jgi:hypothetical protein